MISIKFIVFFVLFCFHFFTNAFGQFSMPPLFSDNMVLQRGKAITIWGNAKPGEMIHVVFSHKVYKAVTDKHAYWKVKMKAQPAGGPYTLTVSSADKKMEFQNVMVGEVWVCSGQSNMEMPMQGWPIPNGTPGSDSMSFYSAVENSEGEISKAFYPEIRLLQAKQNIQDSPQDTIAVDGGSWQLCTPGSVRGFSATAYFFAREVYEKTHVPIGLIHSSMGATGAERWTPKEKLQDFAAYKNFKPGGDLFNGMICPLIPYGIRGVIWYQGEANVFQWQYYKALMATLIKSWRVRWQQDNFPFYYVQLSRVPNGYENEQDKKLCYDECLSRLREAQLQTLAVPNTEMAVTIDLPVSDGHPRNKQDYGYRLAQIALSKLYGGKNAYKAPAYRGYRIKDNKIELFFSGTALGLKTKDNGELKGFEITGKDSVFYPAHAVIIHHKVIVDCREVDVPVAVRYAWHAAPDANLCSKEGLPVSPFRTDNWPMKNNIEYFGSH